MESKIKREGGKKEQRAKSRWKRKIKLHNKKLKKSVSRNLSPKLN